MQKSNKLIFNFLKELKNWKDYVQLSCVIFLVCNQSLHGYVADNVSHPRRLDPTMELITYSFVLYLQHGRHDVKCKPSIPGVNYDAN